MVYEDKGCVWCMTARVVYGVCRQELCMMAMDVHGV